jgi:hypothetical protein
VRGLEIRLKAEKIKAEVYVNQDKSLMIKHSFLLYFPRELLMNFLRVNKGRKKEIIFKSFATIRTTYTDTGISCSHFSVTTF